MHTFSAIQIHDFFLKIKIIIENIIKIYGMVILKFSVKLGYI